VISGFPSAARRIAPLPPTRLGGTIDPGLPTESSVADDTDSDARTLCGRAVVPAFAPAAAELPVARWEAPPDDGPAVALISTIVAMTAITRITGTRAVRTGCRDRKEAALRPLLRDEAPVLVACPLTWPPPALAGLRVVVEPSAARWPPVGRFFAPPLPDGLPPGGRFVYGFFVVGRA
jgi:hypothetical protein